MIRLYPIDVGHFVNQQSLYSSPDPTAPPDTTIVKLPPWGIVYPMNGSFGSTTTFTLEPISKPAFFITSRAVCRAFRTDSSTSSLFPSLCEVEVLALVIGFVTVRLGGRSRRFRPLR